MNAIDIALDGGLRERLRLGMAAGSTIYARSGGNPPSADVGTKTTRAEIDAIAAAMSNATPVSIWCTRSEDGKRLIGEIVLGARERGNIVWNLNAKGGVRIEYAFSQTIRFESATDRLSAGGDPIGMLKLVDDERQHDVAELVDSIGYQPVWDQFGGMTMSFRSLPLEKRRG